MNVFQLQVTNLRQVGKSPGQTAGFNVSYQYQGPAADLVLIGRLRDPGGSQWSAGISNFSVPAASTPSPRSLTHSFPFPAASRSGLYDLTVEIKFGSTLLATVTKPGAYSMAPQTPSVSDFSIVTVNQRFGGRQMVALYRGRF